MICEAVDILVHEINSQLCSNTHRTLMPMQLYSEHNRTGKNLNMVRTLPMYLEEDMNSILHDIEYYLNFIKKVNNDTSEKLNQYGLSLFKSFSTAKCAIHHAFCNSIDTSSVIEQIRELLLTTNNYMRPTKVSSKF